MKKAISIIFIFLLSCAAFAQNYSKPGRNEVVLVFSVEIRPSVNREFFKEYLSIQYPYIVKETINLINLLL